MTDDVTKRETKTRLDSRFAAMGLYFGVGWCGGGGLGLQIVLRLVGE